jgi:hypothetical protein
VIVGDQAVLSAADSDWIERRRGTDGANGDGGRGVVSIPSRAEKEISPLRFRGKIAENSFFDSSIALSEKIPLLSCRS